MCQVPEGWVFVSVSQAQEMRFQSCLPLCCVLQGQAVSTTSGEEELLGLQARAVANRTDACFIRVIGSELVQKYVGEGARMVRELFQMARSKKACLIFFDEVDAIGGARFDDGAGAGI